jgi:hypothetical protein
MEAFLGGAKGESEKEHLVEDEPSSMKSGKITFNQPAGFKLPEGTKDGEPFDAMATLKLVNGKLVLHELDGTPVDDENEGTETDEETPEEEASETPEEESTEDESKEDHSDESESDEGEPSTEEPEANDSGEPEDFLSAIEKKAKKFKK